MSIPLLSSRRAAAMTGVLALLSVFPPLATDMYLAAMGDLAAALHAGRSETELSLSLFFLGLCLGQLVVGPLADVLGRRLPLLAGCALFTIASGLLLATGEIAVFNALRVVQAIGACAGMVVGRAVVNDLYEGPRAAKAMTVLVMLMTLGPIAAPTLGSLLLQGFGWRSIFWCMVGVGALAFGLTLAVIPETRARAARPARPVPTALRHARALMRSRAFVVPALTAGLVQGGMFAFITGSSGVFQGVFGLGALAYGLLFAAIAAALLAAGRLNGRLLDRFAPGAILGAGLPAYALAATATVLVSGTAQLWVFVVPLWIAIGMVGLLSANAMALAMEAARAAAGMGSALMGALQFGLAFAVSSAVALAAGQSALPMSLGLLLPALAATALWHLAAPGPAPRTRARA
ncbi:Bcr/CflA family efflux MFS transporter [Frigidibacter sp. MR17.24]|uniref:Bcr/CflA family efflux MFS transporter n=1 Tax=Frigidibacter sp. MR17.24 TaxID=3127345 RepID=UPI0030130450